MRNFISVILLFICFPLFAGDVITKEQLPKEAINLLDTKLKEYKITKVELYVTKLESKAYVVTLENKYEVVFGSRGNWYIIDFKEDKVPDALIPPTILSYIAKHFKGDVITQIEQSKSEYNLELQSDVSVLFDKKGAFLKIGN